MLSGLMLDKDYLSAVRVQNTVSFIFFSPERSSDAVQETVITVIVINQSYSMIVFFVR